jgi:hypothetical protein
MRAENPQPDHPPKSLPLNTTALGIASTGILEETLNVQTVTEVVGKMAESAPRSGHLGLCLPVSHLQHPQV